MKCIGGLQAFCIWVVICIAVWMFVPDNLTFVHNNAGWLLGLALTGWWVAGKLGHCDTYVV